MAADQPWPEDVAWPSAIPQTEIPDTDSTSFVDTSGRLPLSLQQAGSSSFPSFPSYPGHLAAPLPRSTVHLDVSAPKSSQEPSTSSMTEAEKANLEWYMRQLEQPAGSSKTTKRPKEGSSPQER